MTQKEMIEKLALIFREVEKTGDTFSEEKFFQRPSSGKWSAAENVQHLFLSAKPLVSLFGKPELMLQQWGRNDRPSKDYDGIVSLYLEKIGKVVVTTTAFSPVEISGNQAEQMNNLKSIHSKFIERASQLPEADLEIYQVPHPLLGLLTAKEFLYFTHYHTGHHNETMKRLLA
ncbi:MAG: DinB family protein [Bacteroidota bacterium]|nr:DinB family protein [Bacteroidota bacterium]